MKLQVWRVLAEWKQDHPESTVMDLLRCLEDIRYMLTEEAIKNRVIIR